MENKITAVEWLVSQLNKQGFAKVVTDEEIQKAKQMEMENLMDEYYRGYDDGYANGQMDLITN